MHGCGIKVAEGSTTQAGQFVDDEYVGHTGVCDVAEARQAAKQATAAASLASGLQVRSRPDNRQLVLCTVCISTVSVRTA